MTCYLRLKPEKEVLKMGTVRPYFTTSKKAAEKAEEDFEDYLDEIGRKRVTATGFGKATISKGTNKPSNVKPVDPPTMQKPSNIKSIYKDSND